MATICFFLWRLIHLAQQETQPVGDTFGQARRYRYAVILGSGTWKSGCWCFGLGLGVTYTSQVWGCASVGRVKVWAEEVSFANCSLVLLVRPKFCWLVLPICLLSPIAFTPGTRSLGQREIATNLLLFLGAHMWLCTGSWWHMYLHHSCCCG